jgi:hypothetical protein
MQEIEVIDEFLAQKEMEDIWNYIHNMSWTIQKSNSDISIIDFLECDVSNVEYFNSYLFERVKDSLNIDVKLQRVYFNGQWHGREGDFHTDGCDVTSLIYLSQYQPQWGGFTQVFLSDGREVVVSPYQGRMMTFPGNCPHKGYSFSYQECPMRISLAYKMYLQ